MGVCAVFSIATIGTSSAEPVTYSGLAEFILALPSEPNILDFDLMPAGTTIEDSASAGGITFEYDFDGLPMKVAHLYATTSAPNFLGTGDSGMFHDGDNFMLSFPPGNAIGLFFISADPLLDGDISVTAGSVTAELIAENVHATLTDGSRVYFVGIVDAQTAMTSAHIEALAGGFFLYNVDDIITAPVSEAIAADSDLDNLTKVAVKL
ncbi:MAG: hypothetical protein CL797_12255 [Chromatiales bacterium]|nr:hypothetical protein [Chromatiales bacterium]